MVLVVSVTRTVPPPVAVKASLAPVVSVRVPEKEIGRPVLALRKMPVPVSVIAPVKVTGRRCGSGSTTERPEVLVIVPL